MKRKVFIYFTLIMLLGALLVPQSTFAAATSYRSVGSQAEYNGKPLEKTGNYYIWVSEKRDENYNLIETILYCSSDGKTVQSLKRVKASKGQLAPMISTNGQTIYYGVYDSAGETCRIYKTTIEGKTHKLIKTVKGKFVGYYNNKLYYTKGREADYIWVSDLYQYDLKTKKAKRIRKDFTVQGMYGRYILGTKRVLDVRNSVHYVIDLKTGKATQLPKALRSNTDGKKIYYIVYNSDENGFSLRQCSMKGKSIKKLKYYTSAAPYYIGHYSAYFTSAEDKLLKYAY